jgi:hypothetical protein
MNGKLKRQEIDVDNSEEEDQTLLLFCDCEKK